MDMHRLEAALTRFHRDERGAIMMLVFTAFLIIFMTTLVLYDAGKAARDKMDVQVAADTAAFSQAAIEARAMNMIAYGNVAKRTFYAFDTMYSAAYLGMIEAEAYYAAQCSPIPPPPNPAACVKAALGVAYILSETAEMLGGNIWTMGAGMPGDSTLREAALEVQMIDNYQLYMYEIGPWWSWSEGLTRGIRNGATLTSSWPPPPGNLATINMLWSRITQFIDRFFNTAYYQNYPSLGARDKLPLTKKESKLAHFAMCMGTATSTEYLWMWGEHYARSGKFPRYWEPMLFGILSTPLGCLAASIMLGDAVLPWELKPTVSYLSTGSDMTDDKWLKAMSNVVISYKMHPDRFSETGDRQKYNYMRYDYNTDSSPLIKGGGYFAVARSEIVYDGGLLSAAAGAIQGGLGGPGSGILSNTFGGLRDLLDQPNMWAARWTARMRPMQLPGEKVQSFNGMFKDMLPYMLLASPIAFANSPSEFSLSGARGFGEAALLDLAFLEIASMGMTDSEGARGFVK